MAKILLIDDDPAMRRSASRALKAAGHSVTAYEHGREALRQMGRDAPDLVVTDIFMPEMEGLETIRALRAQRPETPIIAMSGFAFEAHDYLQIAEKFGAAASLRKPFRPAELLDLVTRVLGHKPAR